VQKTVSCVLNPSAMARPSIGESGDTICHAKQEQARAGSMVRFPEPETLNQKLL
jgi:hypothetical protein